jgi:tRNA-splicing ligase RtcB
MEIIKNTDYEWEIPQTKKMNVPGRIFADKEILAAIKKDKTLKQLINVSELPGIIKASFAMPDAHQGYGFPIGGVAGFDIEKGIITPGGVGFDINCGIRLLATDISIEEFSKNKKGLLHDLNREIPSGVGKGQSQKKRLSKKQLDEVLKRGVKWAVENGYGIKEDLERCEEGGCMENANPKDISERAKKRGLPQLGTLGAGNHFIEIQKVEEIFNKEIARTFGIKKDNIVIMIHCGSRGLGHQVCSDYIKYFRKEFPEQIDNLPDNELINAPINSKQGIVYLSAMNCAVNFAFCNRQMIMNSVREILKRYFPKSNPKMVYDVCHNIAKIEEHLVEGVMKKVCVHRKGATRSFGPGRKEIPKVYRKSGQPVIIPGSMGTSSYILVGTTESEKIAWGSTAHGAGRVMSRSKAIHSLNTRDIENSLRDKGIELEAGSKKGIAEEAPEVYKDINKVVEVSDKLNLAKKIARLKPLGVIKG